MYFYTIAWLLLFFCPTLSSDDQIELFAESPSLKDSLENPPSLVNITSLPSSYEGRSM